VFFLFNGRLSTNVTASCKDATMVQPDYRSEKSESVEGQGRAHGRWEAYLNTMEPSVVDAAFMGRHNAIGPGWAKETSELVGFWVAWHIASGFEALETAGWNRATIFRKIRRFRAVFGSHPDEYQFPWLSIDTRRYWNRQVAGFLMDDYDGSRDYDFTNPDLMPLGGDQSESDPEH
jgi:hypothetical protein